MRMTERTLVLLRHAKAERPVGVSDDQRPLTARGHADAAAAGAWLARSNLRPDLVICSPAKRTRQTWHAISVALAERASPTVRYERDLYYGNVTDLLALIRAVDEGTGTLLAIGHNPTVSLLSTLLDPTAHSDSDGLRTCGLAVHHAHAWVDFGPGEAALAALHTARG